MRHIRLSLAAAAGLAAAVLVVTGVAAPAPELTPVEELGKAIFFDTNLSLNGNQSCASCHAPKAGWVGSDTDINAHGAVYEGSIAGAFGDRKPPSAAYATQSPVLSVDRKGLFVGGNFWDGRATGETLGNPAAEQAKGPFLNPVEQALPDADTLVGKVCAADYGDQFRAVWGQDACANVAKAYDQIGLSIAAYEASPEVNAFSSKFDYAMKGFGQAHAAGAAGLGALQGRGQVREVPRRQRPEAALHRPHLRQPGRPEEPGEPCLQRQSHLR